MQKRRNSSALAMELRLFRIKHQFSSIDGVVKDWSNSIMITIELSMSYTKGIGIDRFS